MATEKQIVKDLQRQKRESMAQIVGTFSKAFKDGTLRKIAEPKPV